MSDHTQFELAEDPSATISGFELFVTLTKHAKSNNGELLLTSGCASFGEFNAEIDRLVAALESIRTDGETRFAEGDFGPKPLFNKYQVA